VTQLILEMVEPNMEGFRITLCAVKEWAIIHGVYSNILGFLGGINFAILVAWVCKNHPEQDPPMLLRTFFRTFALWYVHDCELLAFGNCIRFSWARLLTFSFVFDRKWPKPVSLCPVRKDPPEGVCSMPVWDPHENRRDDTHLMPILTPAYPSSKLYCTISFCCN
jgi:poly(A) polymerase